MAKRKKPYDEENDPSEDEVDAAMDSIKEEDYSEFEEEEADKAEAENGGPIKSPYTPTIWGRSSGGYYGGTYGNASAYAGYEMYDDLPASVAWVQTIGVAIGKKFGVKVVRGEEWIIDYINKEMEVGSIEDVYSRRGVLGLILNGVSRVAYGMEWPKTKTQAEAFGKKHGAEKGLGRHIVGLSKFIDEVRTDDKIAGEYAGGSTVVDTMHRQAYEASLIALKNMAMDMQKRRKIAREFMEALRELSNVAKTLHTLPKDKVVADGALKSGAMAVLRSLSGNLGQSVESIKRKVLSDAETSFGSRYYAALLIAADPTNTQIYLDTLARGYQRNVSTFEGVGPWHPTTRPAEEQIIRVANGISAEMEEIKTFASHTGGHAQYVLAKAESFYHARTLGIATYTPYGGYDMESTYLETEEANDAAWEIASLAYERGYTKDVDDSIRYGKDLLPILARFPYLDLNDKKEDEKGESSSGQGYSSLGGRVQGAMGLAPKRKKKPRDSQGKGSRGGEAKDKRQMQNVDQNDLKNRVAKANKDEGGGYSILGDPSFRAIEKYAYFIGPYLSRIATTAARISRYLRVNDKFGYRGAYRRGGALNTRILYRHRLDDFRLFARKEQEKKESYGFAVMADLSSSTRHHYKNGSARMVQDEIIAATILVAEVAERIGGKVRASIGFFSDNADIFKRPGYPIKRASLMDDVENCDVNVYDSGTNVAAAGVSIEQDLEDMVSLKVVEKNIIFISDGGFAPQYLRELMDMAKKYSASIAYFQIGSDAAMLGQIEKFAKDYVPTVKIRTRYLADSRMDMLPVEMAALVKEVVGVNTSR